MEIVKTQERSFIEYVKNYARSLIKSDQGFSLLELSVAVGVLLVASVTAGTLINSNIQRANKQSALEVAVNEGYASATKAVMDFDENTTVVSALAEIESKNFDSGQIILEQVGEAKHQDELCIKGTWFDDPSITLTKGACGTYTPPPAVEPPAVNVPVISSLRYVCDTDVTGNLPIVGASEGTIVRLIEVKNGGRARNVDYNSSTKAYKASMKAGVEYEARISGTFAALDTDFGTVFNKCLTSVQKLDEKSGLMTIGNIGGAKFVSVPETIPSTVTSLRYVFMNATAFNDPNVGKWDVSKVTDFSGMFRGAKVFNQDISSWKVNSATTMRSMFEGASSFNQNIGNWTPVELSRADYMFSAATSFNQDLSRWSSARLVVANNMFVGAISFNNGDHKNSGSKPMNWGIRLEGSTNAMFLGATSFNQNISGWDTSNVKNMNSMFENASLFNNGDVENAGSKPLAWDTSQVTTMGRMFRIAPAFNQYIGKWNTSQVKTMGSMFYGSTLFNNGDIENNSAKALEWNTKQVTDMSWMFAAYNEGIEDDLAFYNSFNQDISKWNTSNVKDMNHMFNSATRFNQTISTRTISGERYWDTSQVTNMRGMFRNAEAFNSDIKNWNVARVTDMSEMFESAEVFNRTLANWNPISVTTMEKMFQDSPAFNNGMAHGVAGNTLTWSDRIKNVENTSYMFNRARAFNQKVDTWNTSGVTNMKGMFKDTDSFNGSMNSGGTNKWNVSNVTDMSEMFSGAKAFNQPLTGWNTSSVTNMDEMFLNATVFKQNTSHLNVSKVVSHSRYAEGSKMVAEPVWVS